MDLISEFLEERCSIDQAANVWAEALYGSYCSWCEQNRESPLNQRDFGLRMKEKSFASERSTGGRARYFGLELTSDPSDPSDPSFQSR
jgi:phage/plasmid-associated DNA primase